MILRPHHLFCMQFFIGKGYNPEFTQNMTRICNTLHEDPDQNIAIIFSSDDLCFRCPNRQTDGTCVSENKVCGFDRRAASLLNLKADQYPFRQLQSRIKLVLNRKNLTQVCGCCEWQKKGVCSIE